MKGAAGNARRRQHMSKSSTRAQRQPPTKPGPVLEISELVEAYRPDVLDACEDDNPAWVRLWNAVERKIAKPAHIDYKDRTRLGRKIWESLPERLQDDFYRYVDAHYAFASAVLHAGFLVGVASATGCASLERPPVDSRVLPFARMSAKKHLERVFSLPLDAKAFVYLIDQLTGPAVRTDTAAQELAKASFRKNSDGGRRSARHRRPAALGWQPLTTGGVQ